jgi:hypothetical protein
MGEGDTLVVVTVAALAFGLLRLIPLSSFVIKYFLLYPLLD